MREAIWWAGLSVVIVFALLSFTPILSIVMVGKALAESMLRFPQSSLKAVVGTNRFFYPPLMLLQESVFWVLASIVFVSTFFASLFKH